jgi:multidrug resistance efflux pump
MAWRRARMALPEELLSLVSLAARTLVSAAATDTWTTTKRGFARLLGRGDRQQTEVAERRLEATCEELVNVPSAELKQTRAQAETTWQTRLMDLLEEHPEMAPSLRALVEQAQVELSAVDVAAAGQGVAAGRDVVVSASGGGVAAVTIHGNVAPGNPTGPGTAKR